MRRLLILLCWSLAILSAVAGGAARLVSTHAPANHPLRLIVLEARTNAPRRLAITQAGRTLAAVPIPLDVTRSALEEGLKHPLWHTNLHDVALGFKGATNSFAVVFLEGESGGQIGLDVSRIEKGALGIFGHRPLKDRETVPLAWLENNDRKVTVQWRTRAWDRSGQRFTTKPPLAITRDGIAHWQ